MADKRVTDLDPIVTAPISGVMHFVDITDSTQNAAGSSFKVTKADFLKENTAAIAVNSNSISANTVSINANITAISSNTSSTATNAAAIALNTAKVGYTEALVSANVSVSANTAKVGITTAQSSAIVTNTAKVSFDSTSSTRLANTSGTNTGDQNLSSYIQGSGTSTKLARFTSSGVIGDSTLTESGTLITSSLPVTVNSTLKSIRYELGADLALIPLGGSQTTIHSFWGLQLVGNTQIVSNNAVGVQQGLNDDASVIIPNQNALKIGLIIKGKAGQTGRLLEFRDSANNILSSFTSSASLLINKTTDNAVDKLQVNGSVTVTTLKTSGFTVATLPAPPAQGEGARAYVTDALNPTFLGTLTGGGTIKCPVFYNGTTWVSA
jgi:hypothetical protein